MSAINDPILAIVVVVCSIFAIVALRELFNAVLAQDADEDDAGIAIARLPIRRCDTCTRDCGTGDICSEVLDEQTEPSHMPHFQQELDPLLLLSSGALQAPERDTMPKRLLRRVGVAR